MRKCALFVNGLSGCGAADDAEAPRLWDYGFNAQALESNQALKSCVAAHLGVEQGDPINPADARELKHLDCIDEGITSTSGLQNFPNLETLSLWENEVDDLSSLRNLTKLVWLELGNNDIRDLSPLARLTNLERLSLAANKISDIGVLSNFDALQWLNLDDNQISDVSPLSNLDDLTWLTIEHNELNDFDVVDAIADGGADVYHQNQSSSSSKSAVSSDSGTLDMNLATLSPRINDQGLVSFDLLIADKLYPARPEFAGQIIADGTTLFLDRGGERLPVGQTDGAVASLCEQGEACSVSIGIKIAPPAAYDGLMPEPVVSLALSVMPKPGDNDDTYGQSDDTLIDYVLASPNQFDAGSCLFMTTTGAVELLIHQHTDMDSVEYNGDTDLSERFLMSAYQDVPSSTIRYWLTDTVYTYNHFGGSLLNRDYPFTAGYGRETSSGLVPCDADDSGAYYSCSYNWFDKRPDNWQDLLVETPSIDRTVAFTDPARSSSSQWNVGLMDDEDVEKIKYLLRTRRAPVVVIYNHYLYWHADLIVGYDDTVSTDGCPMVESSLDYFADEGANQYINKIEAHMDDIGDCTSQGVFYVRDSIYDGGSDEPIYEYSSGFSEKYSKRIIERSYNWVKYLGNHAYSIQRK